ncbi:unnamed protein product [Bursaphelenchus okinawaensis]|uniref:G_PROTEIN_RECEP_F1_2 domain-containing protein n=1 Tax=Bursaphelenchus okinawaensis TaxID=465554 RepID=A0A811LUH5_9BILA|nr:unnamed protein product [Bursaphelenchus okinawaensis]CAG9127884.1 unnamed protein product [Bursaphelenchus okinawaensis]
MGDIFYATSNLVAMTVVEVKSGLMFFLTLGPFSHSPYPANFIMTSIFLTSLYIVIITLGMQFLYRYYALCKTSMKLSKFLTIYSIGILYCLCDGFIVCLIFSGESEEHTMLIKEHPMYMFDTPTYIVLDPQKPLPLFHTMVTQLIVFAVYVLIFYTGRQINQRLNEASTSMSDRTKDAQRQLNRVMVLQAAYPAVIVGLPVLVATICTQLQLNILWSGLYLVPSVSVIPIANSLTIMLVIPTFRRRIAAGLCRRGYVDNGISKGATSEPYSAADTNHGNNDNNENSQVHFI